MTWLTCLFNKGFSYPMCKASLILSWKDVEAVSRIEKQSSEHKALHVSDLFMCWKMCEFLTSDNTKHKRKHKRSKIKTNETNDILDPLFGYLRTSISSRVFHQIVAFSTKSSLVYQELFCVVELLLFGLTWIICCYW